MVEVSGKKVRGRLYPWGVVEVDNLSHCDFATLRNMLIRWEEGVGGCFINSRPFLSTAVGAG